MLKPLPILVLWLRVLKADYCSLSCKRNGVTFQNSACECVDDVKNCNGIPKLWTPDDSLRKRIADVHNEYREKVASGEEWQGGNTGATDMMLVEYDKDLEHVAECHNRKCIADHDKCRITEQFKDVSVGQNFFGWYNKECDWSILERSTRVWYEEVAKVDQTCIRNFSMCLPGVGHYTQMVWAKTTNVGCSILQFEGPKWISCHVFCNYGRAGNVLGAPVYTLGEGGKNCNKTDRKYPHLCANGSSTVQVFGVLTATVLFMSYFGITLLIL